jgi:hypothetical protein
VSLISEGLLHHVDPNAPDLPEPDDAPAEPEMANASSPDAPAPATAVKHTPRKPKRAP